MGAGDIEAFSQDHAEFLSTITGCHGASWQQVAQQLTDMLQYPVAQWMAELVVELFEVIYIQHHQGHALVVAAQCLLQ
ncbi:hypothetical protein D9M68_865830 [compost metagenome]